MKEKLLNSVLQDIWSEFVNIKEICFNTKYMEESRFLESIEKGIYRSDFGFYNIKNIDEGKDSLGIHIDDYFRLIFYEFECSKCYFKSNFPHRKHMFIGSEDNKECDGKLKCSRIRRKIAVEEVEKKTLTDGEIKEHFGNFIQELN